MSTLSRRSLLASFGALLVAPAIVRVDSLMPIKPCRYMRGQFIEVDRVSKRIIPIGNEMTVADMTKDLIDIFSANGGIAPITRHTPVESTLLHGYCITPDTARHIIGHGAVYNGNGDVYSSVLNSNPPLDNCLLTDDWYRAKRRLYGVNPASDAEAVLISRRRFC